MKKKTKPKTKKQRARLVNEIRGSVRDMNIDTPGRWHGTWEGNQFWVPGVRRQYATIQWEDGSISENVPMPILANPLDNFVFTIRPA